VHVIDQLQKHFRQTATRNLSLTNSLLSILNNLGERGIPALPYKGPVLSEAIYSDFSLRQSRDLDILVRPDDFHDAEAILLERGFEPKRELTEKQKQVLVKSGLHRSLKKDGVIVDLHPRISSPHPPFKVIDLLDRAGSVDLDIDSTSAIRPVDNLFALSVHGTKHRWNQLKWICDIAYLIHNETFDWPIVLEESKRRNCYRRVLIGCKLASVVLEVDLPEAVRSKFHNIEPDLINYTYPDCLLSVGFTTSLRYRLRSRDEPLDRILYCWNKITTPPIQDRNNNAIPERYFELYYIYHPIRALSSKLMNVTRTLTSRISTNSK
jgi:hypothetical protein